MKKLTLAVAIALFTTPALSDTIRTSDGISCSFDSDDSPYEVRTYAESGANEYDQSGSNDYYNGYDGNDNRVGIEFTWKFGAPKRLDCDKLYALELRTKEAKVKELEKKVEMLESAASLSNVQW